MRRFAIGMAGATGLAFVVLCALLLFGGMQAPPGLVPEGAQQVSVQRLGIGRQRITYQMPRGATMNNLRLALHDQGWRRLRVDEDLGVQFFTRSLLNRTVRVLLTVHRPGTSRDPVILDVAQCLRFADRVFCF